MKLEKLNEPLSVRDGHLFIEDCDTVELAKEFGTPLFVVSEGLLVKNFHAYQDAFQKHWPEGKVRVMAAVKANPITALRRVLTREGCGCDTFGAGELEVALRGNVPAEDIAVNGSIKGREIIRKAIDLGIHIIIDNPRELDYCIEESRAAGKTADIILRVKPYLEGMDAPSDFFPARLIRDMTQTVKYGIPSSELWDMLPKVKDSPELNCVGTHVHIGRHTKKLDVWADIMKAYAKWIKRISDGLGDGWIPKIVSLGGGFGAENERETRVAVTDYPTPSQDEYAEAMCTAFRDGMQEGGLSTDGMLLEVEPGRALFNETGVHLSTIHNVKHETENLDRCWAEMDTSECFLGLGGLNVKPPFDYVLANKADQPDTMKADLVGITCNYECLMEQGDIPEVAAGDVLAWLNTGSYIEVYTCNFNALPRPATVLVHGDKAEVVKRRETIDEVFARDEVPDRLQ